jgi:hypothetical protein
MGGYGAFSSLHRRKSTSLLPARNKKLREQKMLPKRISTRALYSGSDNVLENKLTPVRPKERRRFLEPNKIAGNPMPVPWRTGELGAPASREAENFRVRVYQPHIPKLYIFFTKTLSLPSFISPARRSISHPASNPKTLAAAMPPKRKAQARQRRCR